MKKFLLFFCVCGMFFFSYAQIDTCIYVSNNGTGDGSSAATPTTLVAAINSILNTSVSQETNFKVLLAAGSYGKDTLSIIQQENKNIIIKPYNSDVCTLKVLIRIDGNSRHHDKEYVLVENLTFDCQGAANTDNVIETYQLVENPHNIYTHNIFVKNCKFFGTTQTTATGYCVKLGSGSNNVRIINCKADYMGALLDFKGRNVLIDSCTLTNCQRGVNLAPIENAVIKNSTFTNIPKYAIRLGENAGVNVNSDTTIIDNCLISGARTDVDEAPIVLRANAPKVLKISNSGIYSTDAGTTILYYRPSPPVGNEPDSLSLMLSKNYWGSGITTPQISDNLSSANIQFNSYYTDVNRTNIVYVNWYGYVEDNVSTPLSASNHVYSIGTANELARFMYEVNNGNDFDNDTIRITSDIDLAAYDWLPIGNNAAPFNGVFDGGNHVISNITINTPTQSYCGFFGRTMGIVDIVNTVINNVDIVGKSYVGGLGGVIHVGRVKNCKVTGNIKVEGNYMVGGLISNTYAMVSFCSVEGNAGSYVRGIYSQSDFEGDNVGGLIGFTGEGLKTHTNCFAKIDVYGTRKVGGLIGYLHQNVSLLNCYAQGNVSTNATSVYASSKYIIVGGLIGEYAVNAGPVTNCYATGNVTGIDGDETYAGLFIGGNRSGSTITCTNSYYNSSATLTEGSAVYATGKTSVELQSSTMPALLGGAYKYVANEYPQFATLDGKGTLAEPYIIASASNLQTMSNFVNENVPSAYTPYQTAYYKQTANIDLAGLVWRPIGNSSTAFQGVYDGDNHEIQNFTLSDGNPYLSSFWTALFGNPSGATLQNFKMTGVDINITTGEYGAAAVAGYATRQITMRNIEVASGSINVTSGGSTVAGIILAVENDDISDISVFENVVNRADIYGCRITDSTANAYIIMGGIIGQTSERGTYILKNCQNYGKIQVANPWKLFSVDPIGNDSVYGKSIIGQIVAQSSGTGIPYYVIYDNCSAQGEVYCANMYKNDNGALTFVQSACAQGNSYVDASDNTVLYGYEQNPALVNPNSNTNYLYFFNERLYFKNNELNDIQSWCNDYHSLGFSKDSVMKPQVYSSVFYPQTKATTKIAVAARSFIGAASGLHHQIFRGAAVANDSIYISLLDAVAANDTTYLADSAVVDADWNIPAGKTLFITEKLQLKVAAGKTITLNGKMVVENNATLVGVDHTSKLVLNSDNLYKDYFAGTYLWNNSAQAWLLETWADHANIGWYVGHSSPYTISTPQDLAGLAVLVNNATIYYDASYNVIPSGTNSVTRDNFTGKTINLNADIDISLHNWMSIGSSNSSRFLGTFDGKDSSITYVNERKKDKYNAIFGYVKDATFSNINLVVTTDSIVAPFVREAENSTFSHINVSGTMQGYRDLAGLVYRSYDCKYSHCVSSLTLTSETVSDADDIKAAGLVGWIRTKQTAHWKDSKKFAAEFDSCSFTGTINSNFQYGNPDHWLFIGGLYMGTQYESPTIYHAIRIKDCPITGTFNVTGDLTQVSDHSYPVGTSPNYTYFASSGNKNEPNAVIYGRTHKDLYLQVEEGDKVYTSQGYYNGTNSTNKGLQGWDNMMSIVNLDTIYHSTLVAAVGRINTDGAGTVVMLVNDSITSTIAVNNSLTLIAGDADRTVKAAAGLTGYMFEVNNDYEEITFTIGSNAFTDTLFIDGNHVSTGEPLVYTVQETIEIGHAVFQNAMDGAVYSVDTIPSVSGAIFRNNKSTDKGAAIYADAGLTITGNSYFFNNEAEGDGGAIATGSGNITINGEATFENNSSTTEMGGAIYSADSLTINSPTTFIGNSSEIEGGAIFSTSLLTITAPISFTQNQSSAANGGAIYSADEIYITGKITLDNNTALAGGAIYSDGLVTLTDSATFTYNKAETGEGGAIYSGLKVNLATCIFKNNESILAGGAILSGDSLHISGNAIFENNRANSYGGAIYSYEPIIVTDSITFNNNYAKEQGGAIYSEEIITITGNSTFIDNEARNSGGAIYANKKVSLAGCTFIGNRSIQQGGAIFTIDSLFVSGVALFEKDTARGAGGAINASKAVIFADNVRFIENISLNSYGGAIYANTTDRLTIAGNSEFNKNQSGRQGGAIFARGVISLDTCKFIDNHAVSNQGGAIFAYDSILIHGTSLFDTNTAVGNGGAVHVNKLLLLEQEARFVRNRVTQGSGGAIYAKYADIVEKVTFSNNVADTAGGAIFSTHNLKLQDHTIFENNHAPKGDAIYLETKSNNVNECIQLSDSIVLVNDTIFLNNDASLSAKIKLTENLLATSSDVIIQMNDYTVYPKVLIGTGSLVADNYTRFIPADPNYVVNNIGYIVTKPEVSVDTVFFLQAGTQFADYGITTPTGVVTADQLYVASSYVYTSISAGSPNHPGLDSVRVKISLSANGTTYHLDTLCSVHPLTQEYLLINLNDAAWDAPVTGGQLASFNYTTSIDTITIYKDGLFAGDKDIFTSDVIIPTFTFDTVNFLLAGMQFTDYHHAGLNTTIDDGAGANILPKDELYIQYNRDYAIDSTEVEMVITAPNGLTYTYREAYGGNLTNGIGSFRQFIDGVGGTGTITPAFVLGDAADDSTYTYNVSIYNRAQDKPYFYRVSKTGTYTHNVDRTANVVLVNATLGIVFSQAFADENYTFALQYPSAFSVAKANSLGLIENNRVVARISLNPNDALLTKGWKNGSVADLTYGNLDLLIPISEEIHTGDVIVPAINFTNDNQEVRWSSTNVNGVFRSKYKVSGTTVHDTSLVEAANMSYQTTGATGVVMQATDGQASYSFDANDYTVWGVQDPTAGLTLGGKAWSALYITRPVPEATQVYSSQVDNTAIQSLSNNASQNLTTSGIKQYIPVGTCADYATKDYTYYTADERFPATGVQYVYWFDDNQKLLSVQQYFITRSAAPTYNVNFNFNGGGSTCDIPYSDTFADTTLIFGRPINRPADPFKCGYLFLDWHNENDVVFNEVDSFPNKRNGEYFGIRKNYELDAKWQYYISIANPNDTAVVAQYGLCDINTTDYVVIPNDVNIPLLYTYNVDYLNKKYADYVPGGNANCTPQLRITPLTTTLPVGDTTVLRWSIADACDSVHYIQQNVGVLFPPCGGDNFNPTLYPYNQLPDDYTISYEGHTYPTVRINCLCWTAENLQNEKYSDGVTIAFAHPYDDDPANLPLYGRLYTWQSAVRLPENSTDSVRPDANGDVQGICPEGWRIPDESDFARLAGFSTVDMLSTTGWLPIVNGTNLTGFNAMPSGFYNVSTNRYENLLGFTGYWTCGQPTPTGNDAMALSYHCDYILTPRYASGNGMSIRCVKNRFIQ